MKMKEFTVGGRPGLQKAFAEVLGIELRKFNEKYSCLLAGNLQREGRYFTQWDAAIDTHFDLPAQWDEAMSYARRFYGMDKEEKPIEEQLSKMLGEDNARLRKAGCDMAEAAIRVMNKYDGVHRLSLAVSEWTKAIADEGGRGKNPEQPKEEKPPLPESKSNLPSVDEAGVIAVTYFENTTPRPSTHEQAFFVAGFQECIKWLDGQKRSEPEVNKLETKKQTK